MLEWLAAMTSVAPDAAKTPTGVDACRWIFET